jgi:hypothetical protein
MSLYGDDLVPTIISTRAITINAPISVVWRWMIQLGTDRGGFFSYSFFEKVLWYEFRKGQKEPDFQKMKVRHIVPASIDESKSII